MIMYQHADTFSMSSKTLAPEFFALVMRLVSTYSLTKPAAKATATATPMATGALAMTPTSAAAL